MMSSKTARASIRRRTTSFPMSSIRVGNRRCEQRVWTITAQLQGKPYLIAWFMDNERHHRDMARFVYLAKLRRCSAQVSRAEVSRDKNAQRGVEIELRLI